MTARPYNPYPLPGEPPGPGEASGAALEKRAGHSRELADLLAMVLESVQSPETRRHYARAILEFGQWRGTPASWRDHLREEGLSPSSINQKLAAIRKLADLAADAGLITERQAAEMRATKNVRELGNRSGMWLTQAQAQALIEAPDHTTLKGKRDRAALALLVGCGLRREEAVGLDFASVQQRDGRWVIPDLRGKHGRIRTVPVPAWVKAAIDRWQTAAQLPNGRILRAMDRHGRITGDSLSDRAVWDLAAQYGGTIGVEIGAHDLRRTCAKICRKHGGELEQIQMLLGHASIQTTERYLGTEQDLASAPNDRMGLKWRDQECI